MNRAKATVLVHVPVRRELSDNELLDRLRHIHTRQEVELIALQLQDVRRQGQEQAAESLKARFTYRMYDISEFFKAGKKRQSGARPMAYGDWGGLCTLRNLRLQPISRC